MDQDLNISIVPLIVLQNDFLGSQRAKYDV